jgi:hypothetical protein
MLALGALGAEDFKVTYRLEDKGLSGGGSGVEVEYHSKWYKRTVNKAEDTLLDYQNLVRYEIDHAKRVVRKTSLVDEYEFARILQDRMTEFLKNEKKGLRLALAKRLFGAREITPSVEKLGNEVVAGRNCEIWKITVGKASCQMSVDPSLVSPTPPDALEEANRLDGAIIMLDKSAGGLYVEMLKVRGIQLKSDVRVPFWVFTLGEFREATEVTFGPIHASMFELPGDYVVEDDGRRTLEKMEASSAKNE